MSDTSSQPDYFDSFPNFTADPRKGFLDEFARLAKLRGWGHRRYQRERRNCMIIQFDRYLADVDFDQNELKNSQIKLRGWQGLCAELRVRVIPPSITQCKKVLGSQVHVNIVDLIDSRRMGTPVTTFRTYSELKEYTIRSGKLFPRARAKEDGLLRVLMRKF